MLGFAKSMRKFPAFFKPLFVNSDTTLTGEKVFATLVINDDAHVPTKSALKDYLLNAPLKKLEMFLKFTTGSPILPDFGLGKIDVTILPGTAVTGRTCSNGLALPEFEDTSKFSVSLDSTMEEKLKSRKRSFNCV